MNPTSSTELFGGPAPTGPVNGLQAEYARIPWAVHTLIPIPDSMTDDQAILLSDILPTSWFGAQLAGVRTGDTVAVFGAGVVGQLAIVSAFRQGAGRVWAVDGVETRLARALEQNAEVINFNKEDPVKALQEAQQFEAEVAQVAPNAQPNDGQWVPGDAPSQASQWAVESVSKCGQIGIIGVYPPTLTSYPIGAAMNKNLTLRMGNCNHRAVTPPLLDLVASGVFDPTSFITEHKPVTSAIEAYESFDRRDEGWIKTVLDVQ